MSHNSPSTQILKAIINKKDNNNLTQMMKMKTMMKNALKYCKFSMKKTTSKSSKVTKDIVN